MLMRVSVFGARGPERVEHDRSGHATVRGDTQRVAGVVVEPGEDLGVGLVGEGVVGEVGLRTLVGLVGFEADVGGPRPFLRFGGDEPGADEVAVDRCRVHTNLVVMFEMPADRVGAGIESRRCELFADRHDERNGRRRPVISSRRGTRPSGSRSLTVTSVGSWSCSAVICPPHINSSG